MTLNMPVNLSITSPVSLFQTPDAKELMQEVLLNKQVLLSFDELLRPAVADITRVLELTGQPVETRKAAQKRLHRRTLAILKELKALITVIAVAADSAVRAGRLCTDAETAELVDAGKRLDRQCRRIDHWLSDYVALWQEPTLGSRANVSRQTVPE